MHATLDQGSTNQPRFALAWAGFALAVISPLFWVISLGNNFLQRTAMLMWVAMMIGVALAGLAFRRDPRKRTRIVAGVTVFWALFSLTGYLAFTRLPPPASVGDIAKIVDEPLHDHLGQQTSLDDLLREDNVLLVFYRGHW